jgi:predicted MFS family arabinose efflux permease
MSSSFTQKLRQSDAALTALHAQTLVVTLAASSASTPLYALYRAEWTFSPFLLTVAFAAYAIALLLTLLFVGRLSDRIGRRPVILGALLFEGASMLLFLNATDIGWLIGARLVLGVATGLATSALSAAIIDLSAQRGGFINGVSPLFGMGVGALGGGLLAQYAPAPLHFIYALLLGLFALQFIRTWFSRETAGALRPDAWQPLPKIAVPPAARATLLLVSPVNIAAWALCGFYLSLMPSLLQQVTGITALGFSGLAVALLAFSGAAAVVVARHQSGYRALAGGTMAMIPGSLLILVGIISGSVALLLVGSVFAGAGLGAGFLGAIKSIVPLAEPHERAGLMAVFYIESYLANALPAMSAGLLVQVIGLKTTAQAMSLLVLCLSAIAAVTVRKIGRQQAAPDMPHA